MPMTWHLLPDDAGGNNYQWVVNNSEQQQTHDENRNSNYCRLPSVEDLLFIQGPSKLFQNTYEDDDEKTPMFRTGSGKSVEVKKSSVLKALSVLNHDVEKSSMFRTGSGKALTVLNDDNDYGGSFKHLQKNVKSPSMMKVVNDNDHHVAHTAFTRYAGKMHATGNGCNFSNSLFQTGSGKTVNVSPAGIARAKTLLGLGDDSDQVIAGGNLKKRGRGHVNVTMDSRSILRRPVNGQTDIYTTEFESKGHLPGHMSSDMCKYSGKTPTVKFQTAGGRSISVSNDALQRAMSLLGDPEFGDLPINEGADGPLFSSLKENSFTRTSLNKEDDAFASRLQHDPTKGKSTSEYLLPPKGPFKENPGYITNRDFSSDNKVHMQGCGKDSVFEGPSRPDVSVSSKTSSFKSLNPIMHVGKSLAKEIGPRTISLGRSSGGPLVDISNNIDTAYADQKHFSREKRNLGKRSSISPFKMPRSTRFSTPLTSNISFPRNGSTALKAEESCCKGKISVRYPFQVARATVKDFFGRPPCHTNQLEHVPPEVRCMNAESAATYMFHDASHLDGIGAESFHNMLAQCGVSMQYVSRGWVENHYKWIVWKLACYERSYPTKATGKYLTVSNVLEELKYRYEREVNHAHRSALKRILEGDASPSSMVVLCISAIRFNPQKRLEKECVMAPSGDGNRFTGSKMAENCGVAKIELTDGWYAMDAILDVPLSKQLVAGKLFVGQKLRIWRAGLCGWVGPISSLEPSKTVSLQLHINGTYRAHWADRLGICKAFPIASSIRRSPGAPLAFSCIKSGGGLVPKTLVGVSRIYPILYKERLIDGGSVVRSEMMENKMLELYNQKRSTIAEGIISEFQKDVSSFYSKNESDSEEGAKIMKILENAAEPEMIMADMSTEQLTSVATYQAKQEAIKQSDVEKKIGKALEDAGLSERQVTPFMRVRVVSLTNKDSKKKGRAKEGLITIWNPTEKQQHELVEGQAYIIGGLMPPNFDSETVYLHARGSTTSWQTLSPLAIASFEPFFSARRLVFLSNMDELPQASEFDIAAVVVHVGEVYTCGHQKRQWVFVTDGSTPVSESKESPNSLLAISFCTPTFDNGSSVPINYALAGSTIGFCNMIKREPDRMNHLWVAEATDNSTYSYNYDIPGYSHLKEAAGSASKWAKTSPLAIQKLKKKILFIVGKCET
ncbi:hypothetical protein IFM89_013417 [Coptis chinensis]|uniref:Tower domain-containing protein n=1 Tax=Coptis chinensis TaxID=261450 RepID=A0A835LBR0_9MAGN|nr:hypothetical protein IFM89_013417 [Coptis chinensis]